jgi:glutathione S-transferase
VPILEHLDGTPPLTESLVITEYLEDRWPKIQP